MSTDMNKDPFREVTPDRAHAERLLYATFDSMQDGLLVVDLAGYAVYQNTAFRAMWPNLTAALMDGGRLPEAIAVDASQLRDAADATALAGLLAEDPTSVATGLLRMGDDRVLEYQVQPQLLDGDVTGRIVHVRDVTARLATEQALRESETGLQRALEATEDCIWELDLQALGLQLSPMWDRLLGCAPEAPSDSKYRPATFDAWLAGIHADDSPQVRTAFRSHLDGRDAVFDCEFRIRGVDGGWRWLRCRGKIVERSADGEPRLMVGTFRDIGALKRADLALRELVQGTVGITGQAFFGTCVQHLAKALDLRGALIGESRTGTIESSRPLAGCVDGLPTEVDSLDAPLRVLYQAGFYCVDDDLNPRHSSEAMLDGSPVRSFIGVLMRNSEGTVIGHLCAIDTQPLRDPGRAQTVLQIFAARAASELERQLAADALSASETRRRLALEKSRDLAVEAARIKAEFMATVSHEIRTPLHGALGLIELLLGTSLDTEQRDYIDTIQNCGNSLVSLLDDVLDLARIEADHKLPPPALFDPRRPLDDILALLAASARSRHLRLTAEIDPQLPHALLGHEQSIRQILMNLVANGLKFTDAGGVTVQIGGRPSRLPDRWDLVVEVTDTGIGIAQEHHGNIFKPFVQLDGSSSRRHGGTGLGLAICQGLCERLGALLFVRSEMGKGATFTLEIPGLAIGHPASTTASNGRSSFHRFDRQLAERHPLRILLAEDNAVNRKVALLILARMGYEADVAVDGFEVLDRLRERTYDLIIMDVQMPGLDGVEVTRRIIKEWPVERRPRIIGLSANALHTDHRRGIEAGMSEYLTKPVGVARIEASLRRCQALPDLPSKPSPPHE